MQYDIAVATRVCARTGRELLPGERYMAVLYEREERLHREDISMEAWQGTAEGAFAWWQAQVPSSDRTRSMILDDSLIYDCFIRLENDPEPRKVQFRYVLAFWLMRKKKLRFEEVEHKKDQDWILLREATAKKVHKVADPRLSEEAIQQVQQEVLQMLQAA